MTVWLVRHGATEWSESGRHTGRSDVPLTPEGEDAARSLSSVLGDQAFAAVLTSPLVRAVHTAELAGFSRAEVDQDLVEWDYGVYEGVTTPQIRESIPGWTVWTHDCPGGESALDVQTRLDRVVARARGIDGDVLIFGHGHALRALTARWLGEPVAAGRFLRLDTVTVSFLGYERDQPVITGWNVPPRTASGSGAR